MKHKYTILLQAVFLFGCSDAGQRLTTEFKDPKEGSVSQSKLDILSLQSNNFTPFLISSQTSQTTNSNLQKEDDPLNLNDKLTQNKAFKSLSPLIDPEKAKDLINKYRKNNNLKPVKLNADLTEAAKAHSKDLSKWDRISHYGSDGSNPLDRINRTGYKARISAENIGTGQSDFQQVFDVWTKSPAQNKNLLLSEASEMGLALVEDPKTEFKSFWTLILAAPI